MLPQYDRFSLRGEVDGERLFEEHFTYADALVEGEAFDPADAAAHARNTITRFLVLPFGPRLGNAAPAAAGSSRDSNE